MADRYPGYDVLAKRNGPSWNEQTRKAVDERLALADDADILTDRRRATLRALADRIVPQPQERGRVNTAGIVLEKIGEDAGDGFRPEGLPRVREAWERGLDALEAEALCRHARSFAELEAGMADAILAGLAEGDVAADWRGLDPQLFWTWRILPDLTAAYYAHPAAWSAMGFGGPASPRGYVRLDANRRDAWEAAEQGDGTLLPARARNARVR